MNTRSIIYAIALVAILVQCKSKEEATLGTDGQSTSETGFTVPDSLAAVQKPARPVETSPSCYTANASKLEIISNNDMTQGSFTYLKNGKKMIDGLVLGTIVNDTIKTMVMSSVNGVSKPQDVWFVISGDDLILLEGELKKDEKNAYRYSNVKALKSSATFLKGACK